MKTTTLSYLLLFLLSWAPASAQEKLVLKGSDTMGSMLVPALIAGFQKTSPGVRFELYADGSATGIEALLDGTADIGISSRRARPQEYARASSRGVVLRPTMVCWDGIAVIVNENLPVEDLSLAELRKLFTGEIKDWKELGLPAGSVNLYTRTPSSGTYLDFETMVMNRRDYSLSVRMMMGNRQIAQAVSRDRNGIGYVGMAYTRQEGVKVLRVEEVYPSVGTVLDKTYPVSRPNFFYTDGEPRGSIALFIDFVLSAEGQSIVQKQGFVPVESVK